MILNSLFVKPLFDNLQNCLNVITIGFKVLAIRAFAYKTVARSWHGVIFVWDRHGFYLECIDTGLCDHVLSIVFTC